MNRKISQKDINNKVMRTKRTENTEEENKGRREESGKVSRTCDWGPRRTGEAVRQKQYLKR